MRRGEIAINVIVIIALSLLVLIILAAVLTGSFQRADKNVNNCKDTYSGVCMARSVCDGMGSRVVEGVTCGDTSSINHGEYVVESYPEGGTVCCVTR